MNRVSFRNKERYSNYNSFIVNFPRDEFLVDIAEMGYLNGESYYLFLCIDILFSNFAYWIEMPNKNSNSTTLILRNVFNKMGIPKAIASDDGREFKGRFKEILNPEGIQHIIMTTHLSFIDRFTRTIKKVLFERVQDTKKDWHRLLPNVIIQYNNAIHESTNLRPVDAIHDKMP